MRKKIFPEWIVAVRKKMVAYGMTQKELSESIGLSYQYVRNILSGRMYSEQSKKKICDYLGIDADEENVNT